MTNPYREGSKLHDVYAVFEKDGMDAAVKYGLEVAKLSPSTLKIQAKRMNWGGEAPKLPKAPSKKQAAEARHRDRNVPKKDEKCFTLGARGVRMCVMVEPGEQQSVIRWLDNDQKQAVPNGWLHPTVARVK